MSPPTNPRVVLKFGGTSVSSGAAWRAIAEILRSRIAGGFSPVVVHSALRGVTDLLERLPEAALAQDHEAVLREIDAEHDRLAGELGLNSAGILDVDRRELEELARGLGLLQEVTPRSRARILAFGERMATRLGAAWLADQSLPVIWVDARELLTSVPPAREGAPFGEEPGVWLSAECSADPDPEAVSTLDALGGIPLTQGFTARHPGGDTVVLGRGGSDTAAAYLAGKLSAARLEIWTDVPGMFSADPRVVPSARLLRRLDYAEAQEVATTGSAVLHPRCIPAIRRQGIPIRIYSTRSPAAPGTVIEETPQEGPAQLKAISRKKGVVLIEMETVGMWQEVGFLARAFQVFSRHGLSIDLVSTSETSVTVSLDEDANLVDEPALAAVVRDLEAFCRAAVIRPCAAVSLVGRRIRGLLHRVGPAFEVFEHQRIHLLSQASSDLNLTVVVDEDQADRLVARLHEQLIARADSPEVFGPSWDGLEGREVDGGVMAGSWGAGGQAPWWVTKREELLTLMEESDPQAGSVGEVPREAAYVYDLETVGARLTGLTEMAPVDRVLYAMKANNNPDVLRTAYGAGAGFECVSPGEVRRVLDLFPDLDPGRVLFTPNFAGAHEYAFGLAAEVRTTLDSLFPLREWPEVFAGREVFVRVDPGVGRGHHEKVQTAGAYSKFGVPLFELDELVRLAEAVGARVTGLHAHAGSGILAPEHWESVGTLLAEVSGRFPHVRVLDVGGGLGVPEKPGQQPLDLDAVADGLQRVRELNPGKEIWIEPGRYVVAEAGVLLARVTQLKGKGAVRYLGVATGMNSLIRPALYGAYHPIVNLTRLGEPPAERSTVVGPICESGDRLGLDRLLPKTESGDVLLIGNAGAYGHVMGSRYNLREPATELVVG